MIYLDNAATSPIHQSALKKVIETYEIWANPSSLHKQGKINKQILEESRTLLKKILNVESNAEIIFTPSATIANNIILQNSKLQVLTSNFEHPSILKIPNIIQIDLNKLEFMLKQKEYLVSLSLVNNESGLIVATQDIIRIVNKYNSKLHIDASQAKHINFKELNCHYLTISSHKIGGPVGIACLITKTLLDPIIYGGGQEFNIFSGTEAIPLIAGFAQAAKELNIENNRYKEFNQFIKNNINPKFILNNFINKEFANHIICLLTYDHPGTEIFSYMDLNNIAVSYGSACSSGALDTLKILKYLKTPSLNGIRISFGHQNTMEEVKIFVEKFNEFFYSK